MSGKAGIRGTVFTAEQIYQGSTFDIQHITKTP
jgi:hypothetical protein